jgi:hypothetical protein
MDSIELLAKSDNQIVYVPETEEGGSLTLPLSQSPTAVLKNASGVTVTTADSLTWDSGNHAYLLTIADTEGAQTIGSDWSLEITVTIDGRVTLDVKRLVWVWAGTQFPEIVSGTNSYVTLEEAYDYAAGSMRSSSWESATERERSRALIQATRTIDSLLLRGVRAEEITLVSQSLEFPRAYLVTDAPYIATTLERAEFQKYGPDQQFVVEDAVPDRVKRATVEEALARLAAGGTSGVDRAALQAAGVSSISIGSVSESYTGLGSGGGAAAGLVSSDSARIMRPYLVGSVVIS